MLSVFILQIKRPKWFITTETVQAKDIELNIQRAFDRTHDHQDRERSKSEDHDHDQDSLCMSFAKNNIYYIMYSDW